jgi:hypothetical protein
MLRRVLVFRIVAATDVTACQADAQVHPTVAGPKTFFATVGVPLAGCDFMEVCAILVHGFS